MVKHKLQNTSNLAKSSAPGERTVDLAEYKERMGLPNWKSLSEELKEISERHDVSWAQELQARVELHRKYVEYQTLLAQNFSSLGLQHINALHNVIDLQNKLFSLEEDLRKRGVNPLESPEWIKARELLSKDLQFIHKHGLDQAKFQANLSAAKNRMGDDVLFVVENEEQQ